MTPYQRLQNIITKDYLCPNCKMEMETTKSHISVIEEYSHCIFCGINTSYNTQFCKIIYQQCFTIIDLLDLKTTAFPDNEFKNKITVNSIPKSFDTTSILKFINLMKTFQ